MRTLLDSFGTVPALTAVLLLQLFILHAIVTGRIVRIVRLLILTPFLVVIFCLFFASPNRLNHRAEKLDPLEHTDADASTAQKPRPQSATLSDDELAPSAERVKSVKADLCRDHESPLDFADVSARNFEPGDFDTARFGAGRIDSGRAALFRNAAGEQEMRTDRPTELAAPPEKLAPVAPTPGAIARSDRRDTKIADGTYSGAPKPLAGVPVPYNGSQATLNDSRIRSADYTAAGAQNGQTALPVGFEAGGVKIPSLLIAPDRIELSDENSRNLMDYFSRSIRERIEETRPAVVHIEATVMKEGVGGKKASVETGGGVIVKTGRGDFYVITNNHVAGAAVSVNEVRIVLHDHRVLHPTNVLPCPEFDLALLPLAEKNLRAAPLGDSDAVKMIDPVFAVGSPFGLEGSISSGIISGTKRRDLPIGKKGQFQNFLQTDAAINPGNSGGPLLNTRGQVIGIVTVIATKSGANEGVGLAIPINHVKYVAGRLIRDGVYRRPFIGLDLDREFTAEQKAALGLRRSAIDGSSGEEGAQFIGTRVSGVKPGSPADRAGLLEGDVIFAYNGHVVEDGEHFNHLIGLSTVDEICTLDILRGSERVRVAPKLAAAK